MTTLLVTPARLARQSMTVEGEVYRHLVKARRLTRGERLRAVDGLGAARWARVAEIGRHSAVLALGEPAPPNEPVARVEVWVAPPRPRRASWMVEKLTEVGVTAVRFMHTERAPRAYGDAKIERLRRVAVAAVEQCERSFLPEVTGIHSWAEALERLESAPRRWLLLPGAAPWPAGEVLPEVALLVGPEGGWSESEAETLTAMPCRPVGLGPTTLRVETAAVVAAARALMP